MTGIPYWRLSGFYFFYFAFVGAMAPFWGLYLHSLEFNAFQIGVLMSLLQVMRIFAPNIWGHIADRTGKRVTIVQLAALVCLIAFVGVFFAKTFWPLFAVMSLISFFWSASLPLVEATTLSHLGDRTDRYGRIRLWGSVGFILVVVGLGALLDHASINLVPWVVFGLLVGIVLTSRVIPEAEIARHELVHIPLREVLRRPEVVALFAAALLMAAAHGPYYTFFTIHLVQTGYSKSLAGWLWALGVVCEIGIFLVMPRVFRSLRVETVLLATLLLAAVRFLLIGWQADNLPLLLLAQLLHAFTFGAYHASALALVHRHFTGRNQARGQALYNSVAFGVGGTLGSLYSGAAWDALGAGMTFSIASACALLAALAFVWKRRRENTPPAG
ncbi:MAG: MFS transporter [Hydrogenophilales bacterium CG_4_9_14_3_um_filter_63_34]|nr:MAG: MFS transporter [Hydrogenophilales bacterium CG_4_10_14_3_um_filter_63_21]PJB04224.1 MAG: MFS transporter [Hydrogenophilales bacterium CG_4_9_14_3_um_filter_63_34]